MANIRKTFNFRNGVQVDDDNLIVNPLGLVGVGTTVPTESLDVRGNLKVVGFLTASEANLPYVTIGVGTVTSLRLPNTGSSIIGAGISIASGIVTAISGLATYYGDGRYLRGLPTSQWLDVDVGLGFTSIYAQGYVGVGTYDPRFTLQVGGTYNSGVFERGVGISSSGDILATGVATAFSFSGIGSNITLINANNISSGTISTDRIPTLRTNQLPSNINAAGIVTAVGGFIGTIRGSIYGNGIGIYTGSFFGDVVGIATTARDLTSDARVSIDFIRSNQSISGITTILTRLDAIGSVGIGTTVVSSLSDLYVKKSGISSIQVSSDTAESYVTLSRGINQTFNAASILYGNTNGYYPYSSSRSFDIINYDLGNVNTYIHRGTLTGINTGSFNWIYGKDPANPLMSLTYKGNLGLGNTNPSIKLDVVGSASISNDLNVIANVSIGQSVTVQDLYVTNVANIPGLSLDSQTKNLNITSGVSTFNNVQVNGLVYVLGSGSFGIGTTQPRAPIQIGSDNNAVCLFSSGIGIGTTAPVIGLGLDARSSLASFQGIGVGTISQKSYVDFSNAGKGLSSGAASFVLFPSVSQSNRSAIDVGIASLSRTGGLIFNNTANEFQGYDGTSWVNLGIATASVSSDLIRVGTGVTINSGIITATNGFTSGIGITNPVKITVVGNLLTFTVAGVGATSLRLY
jgi:hypothetical protein